MEIDLLHPEEPFPEDEALRPISFADTVEEGITPPRGSSVGCRLGPYRLLERIGRGGMGEIWRAEDLRLGRKVAIKLLPPGAAGKPSSKARFLQEARAASALDHPNICSIYEVGETGDQQLYLVMPCYQGEPLQERIARGPLPVSEVLDLAGQIAKGLNEAHRNRIVHRDIKPSNLMITGEGTLKILDFGIAKLEGQAGLTRAGVVVGTLAYMSPEQLRGEPVDERTDLWALGVVIYEMLTGCHPFPGEQAAVIRESILHAEPKPLKQIRPEVPAELDRLVASLLSKDPATRIPSAASVGAVLKKIGERASSSRPVWLSWMAAHRWRLAIGLVVLGLVMAGGLAISRRQATSPTGADLFPASKVAPPPRTVDRRRSLAVLEIRNLSVDTSDPWLGPALTEMFTAELAAGGKFRVVTSERTAQAWKSLGLHETESFDRKVLERLHALVGTDLIVMGACLSVGERGHRQVRLDLQVMRMPKGGRVANFSLNGTEPKLIDLVAQAGSQLRSALGFSLPTSEERLQARELVPASSDAIRLYAEGLSRLRSFDFVKARDLLVHAEKLEPTSVVIHSALAETWTMLGQDTRAREAALRAFDGRQSLPLETRLVVEARFRETGKQWDQASEIYRSLQTMYPDELEYGLKLATTLSMAGRGSEALAVLDELRERPFPEGEDPRIDITEMIVAYQLPDLARMERAAESGIAKGRRLGGGLIVARGLIYKAYFESLKGRPQKAVEALREAEELALRAGDRFTAGRVDGSLGMILWQQGDLDGAERAHQRALSTAQEISTVVGLSYELFDLGLLRREQGDLREGRAFMERSLIAFQSIDYQAWEARAKTALASMDLAEGDLASAQKRLFEAVNLSRSIRNSESEAQALVGMAELKAREGDLDEALRLQANALQILVKLRNPRLAAEALADNATLLMRSGDVVMAYRRSIQAQAAERHAAHRLISGRLLGLTAHFARLEGDLAAAQSASNKQLLIARESRDSRLEAPALRGLALVAWARGEIPRALELLHEARSIAEKSGERLTAMEISVELARVEFEGGDFDASLKLAREAADWYHARHFSDESLALAVSAEALLHLGQPLKAREAAARSQASAPEADRELHLQIAPALARVEAARGDGGKALRDLGSAVTEAEQAGFVTAAFEARLAKGEILLRQGETEDLRRLQKDAEAKGFRFISQRAAGLLAGRTQSTAKTL